MAPNRRHGALLVAALVLNVGWLWLPLGLAALGVASFVFVRATRDRWSVRRQVLVLAVVWAPFVYLVATSGLTVGVAGTRLLSLPGDGASTAIRAATGALVPLLAGGLLAVEGDARTRKLARGALLAGLVVVPAAVAAGTWLVPDVEDVNASGPPGGVWLEIALVAPIVATYAAVVAAAVLAWRGGWRAR